MSIHVIYFLILSIFSYIEYIRQVTYKTKRIIIFLILTSYVVYSVLYNGPAGDYNVYEYEFVNTSTSHFPKPNAVYFEYLYELLSFFVRLFTGEYKYFRLVLVTIVMVFWYSIYTDPMLTLGHKYNFLLMLMVWVLIGGGVYVVRSTVGIAICLYSLRFIRNRRFIKFCICMGMALGFHTLTVTWIPMYFVFNRANLKNWLLCILAGSILFIRRMPSFLIELSAVLSYIPIIGERVSAKICYYVNNGVDNVYGLSYSHEFALLKGILNIAFLIVIAQYVYFVLHRNNICNNVLLHCRCGTLTARNIYTSIFIQYLIGSIILVVALGVSVALSRASQHYLIAQCTVFAYFFEIYRRKKKCYKVAIFLLFLSYLFLRMMISL